MGIVTPSILAPLSNSNFRWLFLSQLVSLLGTGLMTVALALFAFDLSPAEAGMVLGGALAVKMIAYVTVAPVVGGYIHRLPRRTWLASLHIGRAVVVALLPLVSEIWQLFILVFFLNALAAGFTPVYQALLPDILPDEKEYTQALSLSRLAMEIESLLSPALAAALLLVISYPVLFQLNASAFVLAAVSLSLASVPKSKIKDRSGGLWQHVSFGLKSYLRTPRLRGVLALNLVLSIAGAMIIVNTVVYVRAVLGLDEEWVPLVMIAAGAGSVLAAILVPGLLDRYDSRSVMLAGGTGLSLSLFCGLAEPTYIGLFPIWFMIGFASSLVLIPTGLVLRNSCRAQDRNDYFSANFALTHGMWLAGYLLAGWAGANLSMSGAFACLGISALLATLLAMKVWPANDETEMWHEHDATEHLHLHVHDEHHQHDHEGWEAPEPHAHPHYHPHMKHRHKFVIDEHHAHWPKQ